VSVDPKVRHQQKVASIAATLRAQAELGETVHITKRGVHHVVPLPGDRRFSGRPVDISTLDEVVEIDVPNRRCTAEPGVTFAALLSVTLPHGLIATVVPELEGITLGGAVAGCSVESMSFRFGGFHDSCIEYEVITGAGEVIRCSPEREPQLFHMIHGSYGTLGIVSQLTFDLVPARPFVQLVYRRFPTVERFHAAMRERCVAGDFDFVDGIVHAPDCFVLCLGRFADSAPYTSDYRWLDIYYKSTRERREDWLTTADYCFRYDAECHWLTRTVPPLEWKPVRFALGKLFLGSENLIRWSGRLERVLGLKKRPDVVCDVFIPSASFEEFWSWYARTFRFYPLWVVPYRLGAIYPWVAAAHARRMGSGLTVGDDPPLCIDCAIYGKPNGEPSQDYSRLLEEKTYALGGIKTLISRNHYSRERFWEIYDHERYSAAKARLDPRGVFPDLYDIVHRVR
jgi:FAD/FMN-containing dehydrogenase